MAETKKSDVKKMDPKAMLDAYITKYGLGAIINDMIGDLVPEMTLSEFLDGLTEKGIAETVYDMTLGELFGVKAKTTEPAVLKKKIRELLTKKGGLMVSQIGEELKEQGKHLSVALAAMKKAGELTAVGEKKQMKYSLAAQA